MCGIVAGTLYWLGIRYIGAGRGSGGRGRIRGGGYLSHYNNNFSSSSSSSTGYGSILGWLSGWWGSSGSSLQERRQRELEMERRGRDSYYDPYTGSSGGRVGGSSRSGAGRPGDSRYYSRYQGGG